MRQHIVNLTNHLIGKNRYDMVFHRIPNKDEFIEHVKFSLDIGDVREMSPSKLGEIFCAFEVGDIAAVKNDLLQHVEFSGNCKHLLRDLVSICLASAIFERLSGYSQTDVPRYDSLRTKEVLDELDARFKR